MSSPIQIKPATGDAEFCDPGKLGKLIDKRIPNQIGLNVTRVRNSNGKPSIWSQVCGFGNTPGLDFFFFFMPGEFFLDERRRKDPAWRREWRRIQFAEGCDKLAGKICEVSKLFVGGRQIVIVTSQGEQQHTKILEHLGMPQHVWFASDIHCDLSRSLGIESFGFNEKPYSKRFGIKTLKGRIVEVFPSTWRPKDSARVN